MDDGGVSLWGSHRVLAPMTPGVPATRIEDHEREAAWAFLATSGTELRPDGTYRREFSTGDVAILHAGRAYRWKVVFDRYLGDLPPDAAAWLYALLRVGNLVADERDGGFWNVPYFAATSEVRRRAEPLLRAEVFVVRSGADLVRTYRDRKTLVPRAPAQDFWRTLRP